MKGKQWREPEKTKARAVNAFSPPANWDSFVFYFQGVHPVKRLISREFLFCVFLNKK